MTKSERNSIYKAMLKEFLEDPRFGFCSLLTNCDTDPVSDICKIEELEELMAYKPTEVFYNYINDETSDPNQFWFPIDDSEIRIKILKEVIELTNE